MTAQDVSATCFNFTGGCSGSIGAETVEVLPVPMIFLSLTGGTYLNQ